MRKKIVFQKHDAISFYDTTLEQRREIHELMERRGFAIAMTTKHRDRHYKNGLPGVWNSHFAFEFERMEWRAVSAAGAASSTQEKRLTFLPYEWWKEKLAFVIDNSDSAKDTMLDEQLEAFLANTVNMNYLIP